MVLAKNKSQVQEPGHGTWEGLRTNPGVPEQVYEQMKQEQWQNVNSLHGKDHSRL